MTVRLHASFTNMRVLRLKNSPGCDRGCDSWCGAACMVPGVEGEFLGDSLPVQNFYKRDSVRISRPSGNRPASAGNDDSWYVAACVTAGVEGGVVGDGPPAHHAQI